MTCAPRKQLHRVQFPIALKNCIGYKFLTQRGTPMEPRIHIDHTGFAHRTDANVIPAAYREVLDGKRDALIERTADRIAAILKDVDDFAGEFPGSGANAGELRSAALCFLDYLTPEIPGEPSGDAIMARVVKIMGARS